jgi:hypothetical protein
MALSLPGDLRDLAVDRLGLNDRGYRLPDPEAEAAMVRSLGRYGQLSLLVVCLRDETHQILDGFKRLAAARALGWKSVTNVDDTTDPSTSHEENDVHLTSSGLPPHQEGPTVP